MDALSLRGRSQDLWCYGMGWVRCRQLPILRHLLTSYSFKTGDSHSSDGMLEFASMIKNVHPEIFVHSIYIEEDLSADQRAGFVRAMITMI
jgi:hypothetical protein